MGGTDCVPLHPPNHVVTQGWTGTATQSRRLDEWPTREQRTKNARRKSECEPRRQHPPCGRGLGVTKTAACIKHSLSPRLVNRTYRLQALADLNTVTVGSIPSVRGGVTPRNLTSAVKEGWIFSFTPRTLYCVYPLK